MLMADLLTAAQHTQIRAALQDAIDTFHDTPMVYKLAGAYGGDFMEDVQSNFTEYNILTLVEYPTTAQDEAVLNNEGVLVNSDINVQIGYDNLRTLNLIDEAANFPVFSVDRDYFNVNGRDYKVIFVSVEGPFTRDNILVNLYGRLLTTGVNGS